VRKSIIHGDFLPEKVFKPLITSLLHVRNHFSAVYMVSLLHTRSAGHTDGDRIHIH